MPHILVVDDEKDLTWAVTEGLHFQKYTVSVAYDGFDALRQIKARLPDLILLDISMPNMDGVEVCHHLRMNPLYRAIPIIFLTARSELQNKITAFTSGADDYVCKPFDMRELLARIHAVLRRCGINTDELFHPTEPVLRFLEVGTLLARECVVMGADLVELAVHIIGLNVAACP